jgi:hypothetical protein
LERSIESPVGEALGATVDTAGAQEMSAVTRPSGFIRVRARATRTSAISVRGASTVDAGRSFQELIV